MKAVQNWETKNEIYKYWETVKRRGNRK